MVTKEDLGLTPASLALMETMVKDAGNWSGTPLLGGNFKFGKEERGNLTHLKRKGLVTTFESDGDQWVAFTKLAAEVWPSVASYV